MGCHVVSVCDDDNDEEEEGTGYDDSIIDERSCMGREKGSYQVEAFECSMF
jgi:hypothetical protein